MFFKGATEDNSFHLGNTIIRTSDNRKLVRGKVWELDGIIERNPLDVASNCESNTCTKTCNSISIPVNATSIDDNAFKGNTIPFSIRIQFFLEIYHFQIQSFLLIGCTTLMEVIIPPSVSYIGNSAFEGTFMITYFSCLTINFQFPQGAVAWRWWPYPPPWHFSGIAHLQVIIHHSVIMIFTSF